MIPHLLDLVDAVIADPKLYRDGAKALHCSYAIFLLAQFRETRAYRPLMVMMHLESQILDDLFGDLLTEDIFKVIASVFDGDDEPLKHLIEDPNADEYARSSAGLGTYLVLLHQKKISLDYLEGYFRELFQGKLKREFSHVWSSLCTLSGDLGFVSLLPEVHQAFEEKLCEEFFDCLESIEKRAKDGRTRFEDRHTSLIDDAILEMKDWCCFQPAITKSVTTESFFPPALLSELHQTTEFRPSSPAKSYVSQKPLIGRNDPCPCGSGRKFKKCCSY